MDLELDSETNDFAACKMDSLGAKWIHPCLIPHIAEKVLNYLPPKSEDLLNARLVCKQWAGSGGIILRNRPEIRIGVYQTPMTKFEKLLSLSENSDCIPVSKFSFCQDAFEAEYEPVIKRFLQIFHPVLESISIWFDLKSAILFDKNSFLFAGEEFQSIQFPKLKSIGMDDRRTIISVDSQNTFDERGPFLLEWLVHSSPNLEKLAIQFQRERGPNGFGPERGGYVTQMLLRLFTKCHKSLKNLQILELDVHMDDAILNCLSTICQKTRLQKLHLCMRGSSFKQESLFSLFSNLKFCLEDLRLTYVGDNSNFTIQFPKMERLKLLQITGWNWNMRFENVRFDNFTYPTHLPCLKTLQLNTWTDHPDWEQLLFPRNRNPIISVEVLQLPEAITNRENMVSLVKIFPNLKKLDMHVRLTEIDLLELVFDRLIHLTELRIQKSNQYWERSGKIVDYVFTGIPKEYCHLILKSKSLNTTYPLHNVKEFMLKPGLTNLTKLKRLDIKDLQYMAEITDVTGYLAFLSMASLEYLDAGRSLIGLECMRKLAIKYPQNMTVQEKLPRLSPKPEPEEPFLELPGRCPLL